MKMTTTKLMLLRLFNVTLGRSEYFSKLLKKKLKNKLVKTKEPYCASSKFFSMDDLK